MSALDQKQTYKRQISRPCPAASPPWSSQYCGSDPQLSLFSRHPAL